MTGNTKWFGEICNEVLVDYHEKELAACKENAKCSRAHKRKMCEMMGKKIFITRATSQKLIAALIAATILLLAGCATYIYREKIFDFIVEFYDKYILICDTVNSQTDVITETYSLGYVPEGFELIEEAFDPKLVCYRWKNNSQQILIFRQSKKFDGFFDEYNDKMADLLINDIPIYHSQFSAWHKYVWFDGTYFLRIEVNYPIAQEELQKMMENVKKP